MLEQLETYLKAVNDDFKNNGINLNKLIREMGYIPYLSIEYVLNFFNIHDDVFKRDKEVALFIRKFRFFYLWTWHKQVITINRDLFDSLQNTDFEAIPIEFLNLPYPSFNLIVTEKNQTIASLFFAEHFNETKDFSILYLSDDNRGMFNLYNFSKKGNSVKEAYENYLDLLREYSKFLGRDDADFIWQQNKRFVSPWLPVLLFLNTNEAKKDLITCNFSKSTKTPKNPSIHRFNYFFNHNTNTDFTDQRDGKSTKKSTHLRRGHFHSFLIGKGRSQKLIKWIPPIIVNKDGTPIPNQISIKIAR